MRGTLREALRLLHGDVPAMVLDNLLYDRQSHARAIFLTMTYKRLKKVMTNHFRDSWPVVADPYLKALAIAPHPDDEILAFFNAVDDDLRLVLPTTDGQLTHVLHVFDGVVLTQRMTAETVKRRDLWAEVERLKKK